MSPIYPLLTLLPTKHISPIEFFLDPHLHNPQVLPDTDKHFFDFNIYDWFSHYNINYIKEDKPSKKDFPIKLAGYFNRLNQLYERLKCRECYNLMIPDMKYARTEYYEYDFDKDEFVKKNVSAAYRITVFECKKSENWFLLESGFVIIFLLF